MNAKYISTAMAAFFVAAMQFSAIAWATSPGMTGKLMFVDATVFDSQLKSSLAIMNPDGSGRTVVAAKSGQNGDEAWRADGKKVAFIYGLACCYWNIWLMNPDGSGLKKITNTPYADRNPSWSPDGTQIVFYRTSKQSQIYVMNADGTNQHNISNSGQRDVEPVWSPVGNQIVFISERDGNPEVYVMNSDGANQVRLTNTIGREDSPDWSPDGKKIIFTSNRNGHDEIYVMDSNGTNQIRLTNNQTGNTFQTPTWSPDGKKIAFTLGYGTSGRIYTINSDGTGLHQVSSIPAASPEWQPIPTTNKNITVNELGFTPKRTIAPLGARIGWNNAGTINHSISDSSGVGLFGSGDMSVGGSYAATLFAAGTYTTFDPISLQTGTVLVPISVTPKTGAAGTTFTVKWSSMAIRSGFAFDVQVKTPGSPSWLNYQNGVTTNSIKTSPVVSGTYAFRARLRGHRHVSKWSPVRSFTVQ